MMYQNHSEHQWA